MSTPHFKLVTADDFEAAWLIERRDIAKRDGYAIRAGDGLTIEFQKTNQPERWIVYLGRDGVPLKFGSEGDRDHILAILWGKVQPGGPLA